MFNSLIFEILHLVSKRKVFKEGTKKKSSGKSHFPVNPDGEKNKCHLFGRHVTEPFPVYSAWENRNKKAGRYGIKGGKGSTFVVPRNEDHRCWDVTVAENEETRISRMYKTIRGSTLIRILLPTSMAVERKEKRGNSKK